MASSASCARCSAARRPTSTSGCSSSARPPAAPSAARAAPPALAAVERKVAVPRGRRGLQVLARRARRDRRPHGRHRRRHHRLHVIANMGPKTMAAGLQRMDFAGGMGGGGVAAARWRRTRRICAILVRDSGRIYQNNTYRALTPPSFPPSLASSVGGARCGVTSSSSCACVDLWRPKVPARASTCGGCACRRLAAGRGGPATVALAAGGWRRRRQSEQRRRLRPLPPCMDAEAQVSRRPARGREVTAPSRLRPCRLRPCRLRPSCRHAKRAASALYVSELASEPAQFMLEEDFTFHSVDDFERTSMLTT